jgi:universal stress protein F
MTSIILVPVDIADPAMAQVAFEKAVELAHHQQAQIRLVHVRSLLPVTFMEFVPPAFDEEQQKDCEAALEKIRSAIPFPAEQISSVVRVGSVYNEVLAEAQSCHADLILIGSHRPSMASYLLGSNAATIVRHAPCSVMVVRKKELAASR